MGEGAATFCTNMEERHDRTYFAAANGRSPVDCVWRRVVSKELAVSEGSEAASFLWELITFYERFRHQGL